MLAYRLSGTLSPKIKLRAYAEGHNIKRGQDIAGS